MLPFQIVMRRELIAKRVKLEVPRPDRAVELEAVINENFHELAPWLGWPQSRSDMQSAGQNIAQIEQDFFAKNRLVYHAYLVEKGNFIGRVGFFKLDWVTKQASVGFWCLPEFRGMGLMEEAVNCLIDEARRLALLELNIETNVANSRAAGFAKKLGFKQDKSRPDEMLLFRMTLKTE